MNFDYIHTMSDQFENGKKFDGETRCKTSMPKNSTYKLRIDQSHSKGIEKHSVFIIFEFSCDAVSKMCWLEFRFQNLLFSNLPAKNVPF